MSNMSYCRFENTLRDLLDCADALDDIAGNLAELSKEEARAADKLIQLCMQIATAIRSRSNTWVGLTDEEIDGLHSEIKVRLMGTFDTKDIYRVVEKALKDKNA